MATKPIKIKSPKCYDYQKVYSLIVSEEGAKGKNGKMSDKDAGARLGVSERQIRNARLNGMDQWQADLFCTRAGFHPSEVFGEDWVTEGLFASDLVDGKVSVSDVPKLTASQAWRREKVSA